MALDLFWFDGKAAILIGDQATGYGNACFVIGQTVEDVWKSFILNWATIDPGYPSAMRVDQGSQLMSTRWERRARVVVIDIKPSGIEIHNSLRLGERYYSPLRRIYAKILHAEPNLNINMALRISQKAVNDTMGPSALVPTLLSYGMFPRLPVVDPYFRDQHSRMRAL